MIETYNKETLVNVAKDRGYRTARERNELIGQILGLSHNTASKKINHGGWTSEEVAIIAMLFEMSPREFCDCFYHDLFIETPSGIFRSRSLPIMPTIEHKSGRKMTTWERIVDMADRS